MFADRYLVTSPAAEAPGPAGCARLLAALASADVPGLHDAWATALEAGARINLADQLLEAGRLAEALVAAEAALVRDREARDETGAARARRPGQARTGSRP